MSAEWCIQCLEKQHHSPEAWLLRPGGLRVRGVLVVRAKLRTLVVVTGKVVRGDTVWVRTACQHMLTVTRPE